jgi:hypothetical protein
MGAVETNQQFIGANAVKFNNIIIELRESGEFRVSASGD